MTQDQTQSRSNSVRSAKSEQGAGESLEAPESSAAVKNKQPLDFAKLDLRVEKVDERISPSETNVFDK